MIDGLTRREMLVRMGGIAVAQFGGVTPSPPPAPNPRFAMPPTWETELKEVAAGRLRVRSGGRSRT
jgi:hypothetical protein